MWQRCIVLRRVGGTLLVLPLLLLPLRCAPNSTGGQQPLAPSDSPAAGDEWPGDGRPGDGGPPADLDDVGDTAPPFQFEDTWSMCAQLKTLHPNGAVVSVHAAPSLSQPVLATFSATVVAVVMGEAHTETVGDTDLWYRIRFEPMEGWVPAANAECMSYLFPPGDFARLRHDFEIPPDFLPRGLDPDYDLDDDLPWPQTVPTYQKKFNELTEQWQWFWFRQLVFSMYGHFDETLLSNDERERLEGRWQNLTRGNRAFTNGYGSDTHRDFISDENTDQEPMRQEELSNGGNVVKVLGEATFGGEPYLMVETLDISQPPPDPEDVNFVTAPWLIHFATESTSTPYEDVWKVICFSQLDGKDVPFPFTARGGYQYIRDNRADRLPERAPVARIYVP